MAKMHQINKIDIESTPSMQPLDAFKTVHMVQTENFLHHLNDPEPPSFRTLNCFAKIKVIAIFALSSACFAVGGSVMAGTLCGGTPVAVVLFLTGAFLLTLGKNEYKQEITDLQLKDLQAAKVILARTVGRQNAIISRMNRNTEFLNNQIIGQAPLQT